MLVRCSGGNTMEPETKAVWNDALIWLIWKSFEKVIEKVFLKKKLTDKQRYVILHQDEESACPISIFFLCGFRAGIFVFEKSERRTAMKKIAMPNIMDLGNTWNVLIDGTFGLACLFDTEILHPFTTTTFLTGGNNGNTADRRNLYNQQGYGTGTPSPAWYIGSKSYAVCYEETHCRRLFIFPHSSMVERTAVNRDAAGSSPAAGVLGW